MNICFFCASSEDIEQKYKDSAKQIGEKVAKAQHTIITGGSNIGLMKTLVKTAIENGGKSIGIIPKFFEDKGLACFDNSKLIIVDDMFQRKQKLFELSDAFVILTGGYGTLDELLEIITLKQIGIYNKPIIIYNQDGYYDKILDMFDKIHNEKFSRPQGKEVYVVTRTIEEIFAIINGFISTIRQ